MEITVAERLVPSATLCSACGDRIKSRGRDGQAFGRWRCELCGTEHDRDLNAAVNLDPVSFGTGPSGPELPVQ